MANPLRVLALAARDVATAVDAQVGRLALHPDRDRARVKLERHLLHHAHVVADESRLGGESQLRLPGARAE
eukprot:8025371-Pyramimonas_sp.AAC.1